jgi:hypothetical protein
MHFEVGVKPFANSKGKLANSAGSQYLESVTPQITMSNSSIEKHLKFSYALKEYIETYQTLNPSKKKSSLKPNAKP